jgi:anthranilate/para-aminobenzoate synthase component II
LKKRFILLLVIFAFAFLKIKIFSQNLRFKDNDKNKLEILLINNHSQTENINSLKYIKEVSNFFSTYGKIRSIHYSKLSEFLCKNSFSNFDLIILSGGDGKFYRNDYKLEHLELIRTNKPIIGICQGMQILAKILSNAYHYKLRNARKRIFEKINFNGIEGDIYYNHSWIIREKDIEEDFEVIFKQKDCAIEEHKTAANIVLLAKHKKKPIIFFQGHPEKSGEFGRTLINQAFISLGIFI